MSALLEHVKAARILGESFADQAEQKGDPTGLLASLADAYAVAAERMVEASRAEAQRFHSEHQCTLDHSRMKGKCPACGA
jgi:hypothetical protein